MALTIAAVLSVFQIVDGVTALVGWEFSKEVIVALVLSSLNFVDNLSLVCVEGENGISVGVFQFDFIEQVNDSLVDFNSGTHCVVLIKDMENVVANPF